MEVIVKGRTRKWKEKKEKNLQPKVFVKYEIENDTWIICSLAKK